MNIKFEFLFHVEWFKQVSRANILSQTFEVVRQQFYIRLVLVSVKTLQEDMKLVSDQKASQHVLKQFDVDILDAAKL